MTEHLESLLKERYAKLYDLYLSNPSWHGKREVLCALIQSSDYYFEEHTRELDLAMQEGYEKARKEDTQDSYDDGYESGRTEGYTDGFYDAEQAAKDKSE